MTAPLFALVDVNSAYANMERLFDPSLIGVPLCCLSSNDGNVVARSEEAKKLGIKMSEPYFKIKHLEKSHGLVVRSSNFQLYGDLSARFSSILSEYSPETEIYSIDENFLRVESLAQLWPSFTDMGRHIKNRIRRDLSLPVCVGFGPSLTLSKFANFLAKKNPQFNGVCNLMEMTKAERAEWFSNYDVSEVWGCGRRISARLNDMGIHSVQDLRRTPPKFMRAHFGVVMERTVLELRGTACLELQEIPPAKKEICSSRSFGQHIFTYGELAESITTHVTRACEKLRSQGSTCAAIQVFIHTNRFRTDEPQYGAGIVVQMADPSSDTRTLTSAALSGLKAIYREGFGFKKSGILLLGLADASTTQHSLFDTRDSVESLQIMSTLDALNDRFGRGTLRLASQGLTNPVWSPRAEQRSPCYTTRWTDVPVVHAN